MGMVDREMPMSMRAGDATKRQNGSPSTILFDEAHQTVTLAQQVLEHVRVKTDALVGTTNLAATRMGDPIAEIPGQVGNTCLQMRAIRDCLEQILKEVNRI